MGLLFQAFPPDGRSQKVPSTTKITNPNDNPTASTLMLPCRRMPHLRGRDASELVPLLSPKRGANATHHGVFLTRKKHFAAQSFSVSKWSISLRHCAPQPSRLAPVPGRRTCVNEKAPQRRIFIEILLACDAGDEASIWRNRLNAAHKKDSQNISLASRGNRDLCFGKRPSPFSPSRPAEHQAHTTHRRECGISRSRVSF